MKIMASGPITSWQIYVETIETVTDFIFLGSKITADSDWSHEIERRLLLGRKAMTNLDSVLKSRDITWPTNVCIVKAIVFLVVVYRCESRTIMEAKPWRIDALKSWCWRRLLRVAWTARKLNQSMLKEINPDFIGRTDAKAEAPILWPPDVKRQLIGVDPDAGEDWQQEEKGEREEEMVDMSLRKLWEIVKDKEAWRAAVHGVTKSWTRLSNETTTWLKDTFLSNNLKLKRISFQNTLGWGILFWYMLYKNGLDTVSLSRVYPGIIGVQ